MTGLMNRLKDRTVFVLSLLLLLTSIGSFMLYDHINRSEDAQEKKYTFEKNHEKAYSSLLLFTDKIQSLYRQVLMNRNVTEWLNRPGVLASEMYRLSQIQSFFFELINSHSGIASVYLHNKANNMVLSTPFMLSELEAFPNRRAFERLPYSDDGPQWLWQPIGYEMQEYAAGSPVISMIGGVPSRNKAGAVAINLKAEYVAQSVMDGNDNLLWLDADNRVLLSKNAEIEAFYKEHAAELLGVKQSSFMFKDHLIIVSESEDGGWKLLTVLPEPLLASGPNGKALYKYIVLVLAFALGLLLFWYFRYYRPRQELRHQVELGRNLDDLRSGLIADLLNGKPVLAELENKTKQYQIDLKGEAYQVIVFQIDNYYNFLLSKSNSERFFLNKIIFNAVKWTFVLRFNAYIVSATPENIAVLLCHPTTDAAAAVKLEETIRYIQEDIRSNCGLTVCTGISETAGDISQVHACYTHALLALDYKSVYGKHAIIYYDQLPVSRSESPLRFPKELHKLNDCLKEGSLSKIEELLDRMLSGLMAHHQLTPEWIHAFFAHVLSTIMKFALERRIDLNRYFKEDVFITLYGYEFWEDKKSYILSICSAMIRHEESRPEEPGGANGKAIIEYIDKHFDKPISLNILADKLSMSPSYLSVYIKNQLGMGFVEYISYLRIQKAVKLLDNEEMTIQHIAEQCGYDTVHTFIRQFKKLHQMPPNEYRMRKKRQNMQSQPAP